MNPVSSTHAPRPTSGPPAAAVPGNDNFLPLRHLAALLVIYGHSYDLTGNPGGQTDLIARWLPGFKAGNFAVYIFFVISGYLVMTSILRRPELLRYLRNRCLRIFPGYWLSLAFCLLLLGPLLSTLPLLDYLSDPGTLHFLMRNAFPISFAWELPGVFVDNPTPSIVNGSLWSLGLEMRWYGYLALLLLMGAAKRRWAFTLIAIAFIGLASWEWLSAKPDPYHFRALSVVFVLAALLAHWRTHLRFSHSGMLALILASAATYDSRWFGPTSTLTLLYAVMWTAYTLPSMRWPFERDYSFGIFLYGFPVQQSLLALYPQLAPLSLCVTAAAVTTLLAWLSWHLVESPVLRLKR